MYRVILEEIETGKERIWLVGDELASVSIYMHLKNNYGEPVKSKLMRKTTLFSDGSSIEITHED